MSAALCGCLGCVVCGECRVCGESGCFDCGKPRGAYLALREFQDAAIRAVEKVSRNGRWVPAFRVCKETAEAYFWLIRSGREVDFSDYCQQTLATCHKTYQTNPCLIEAP